MLEHCRSEEIAHRDAARRRLGAPGRVARLWVAMVGLGSQAGVYLASLVWMIVSTATVQRWKADRTTPLARIQAFPPRAGRTGTAERNVDT